MVNGFITQSYYMKLQQINNEFRHKLRPGVKPIIPKILYHGTSSDFLNNILKHGLIPGHSQGLGRTPGQIDPGKPANYLCNDKDNAYQYAKWVSTDPHWHSKHDSGNPIILSIEFEKLNQNYFEPDESFFDYETLWNTYEEPYPKIDELTWQDSLYLGGTVRYTAPIPPAFINVEHTDYEDEDDYEYDEDD
jgi:hypothetical protein